MHAIEGARLKDSIDPGTLSAGASGGASRDLPRIVEGRALILWAPKRPGEKLDPTATAPITPAARGARGVRGGRGPQVKPAATPRFRADLFPAPAAPPPSAPHPFKQVPGGNAIYPR